MYKEATCSGRLKYCSRRTGESTPSTTAVAKTTVPPHVTVQEPFASRASLLASNLIAFPSCAQWHRHRLFCTDGFNLRCMHPRHYIPGQTLSGSLPTYWDPSEERKRPPFLWVFASCNDSRAGRKVCSGSSTAVFVASLYLSYEFQRFEKPRSLRENL